MTALCPSAFERLHIAACYLWPDHIPAIKISALTHGVTFRFIAQQIDHLISQCLWIAKWYQGTALLCQHLFRIPIRRGNNGLACTQRVCQRPRSDLRYIEVGCDVY